jgi:hypothetical protein
MSLGRWAIREVKRIARNPARESYLMANPNGNGQIAVLVDRPEGVTWPGITEPDVED